MPPTWDFALSSDEDGGIAGEVVTLDSDSEPVEVPEPEGLLNEIYKLPLLDESHNGIMKAARCKAFSASN
jgi:hypothetical protein